ncbi:MAG: ABC transporter ATP-binding protein, partial [Mycobacteriales bacterium]
RASAYRQPAMRHGGDHAAEPAAAERPLVARAAGEIRMRKSVPPRTVIALMAPVDSPQLDSLADSRRKINSVWRIRTYARPYRGQIILSISAALIGTLVGIAVPLLTRSVIDGPIHDGKTGALIPLGLLALAFGAVEAFLIFIRRWVLRTSSLGMESDMRGDLYAHLQRLQIGFHDQWQSGQLLSRATSDLGRIRRFVGFQLVFLVVNTMTFFVVSVMLIIIYWPLGVLVTVMVSPLAWISLRFERIYKVQARRVQDQGGEITTTVEEAAGGIRIIKAFGRHRTVFDNFDDRARDLRTLQLAKVKTLALIWAIIEAHPQIVMGCVVLIGAIAVAHDSMSLGTLVAFASLYELMLWPIMSLGWLLASAQEAVAAADRLYDVLDEQPTINDRTDARTIDRPAGRLEFRDVGFTYPGTDEPILHGISLTLRPGETLALVGGVGCGKTTMTSLVPRLYDVTEGAILIDHVDIRDLPLAHLRRIVATAFEEPILFSASARENITLGKPDASDEQVRDALRLAQAEFVDDLPWGLDTRLGEQGMSVSGGQRQRIALARAVIGTPQLLVLDDPLSALDVHTEALVEEALRRVLADTTALIVAHRPSTVMLADRVALIEDGTITAVGTHSELLATVPTYRAILSQDADAPIESGAQR